MHGISVSEIEAADRTRLVRNTVLSSAAGVAAVAVCALGAYHWWQHIAVHTDYFESYIIRNNVAEGVGSIDKNELDGYSAYYEFKSKDEKVQSVEYKNYGDQLIPIDDEATVLNLDSSKITFSYTESGALHTAKYFNYRNLPVVCYQYSAGGTHVTLLQDEESGIAANAVDIGGGSDEVNITKYVQEMKDGRVVRRYYAYGDNFSRTSDENGVFGYDLAYDKAGNLTEVKYFRNKDASVYGGTDGIDSLKYTYGDDSARMESVSYLNTDGEAVPGPDGWAKMSFEWGENNDRSSISYFDGEGAPFIPEEEGYATVKYEYDGPVLTAKLFFDENGELFNSPLGYAKVICTSNSYGFSTSERYFDKDGAPAKDAETGIYGQDYEHEFNEDGIPVKQTITCVDENGKPMMSNSGYAIQIGTINEHKMPLRVEYRDADGKLRTDGYAIETFTYDPIYNEVAEWRFFDAEEKPVMNDRFGFASVIEEYGNTGISERVRFLDEEGNLCMSLYGYAMMENSVERDGSNTIQTVMYYDQYGKGTASPIIGSCGARFVTNEQGRVVEYYILGADKSLEFNEGRGFASVAYSYDEYGNSVSATYFGENGYPMINELYGYASVGYLYDAMGNILYVSYTDNLGNPIIPDGMDYASVIYEYTEDGEMSGVYFHGENKEPVVNQSLGYAAIKTYFNDNGDPIKIEKYTAEDGKLVLMED